MYEFDKHDKNEIPYDNDIPSAGNHPGTMVWLQMSQHFQPTLQREFNSALLQNTMQLH